MKTWQIGRVPSVSCRGAASHGFDAGLALTAQPDDFGAAVRSSMLAMPAIARSDISNACRKAGAAHQRQTFDGMSGEKHGACPAELPAADDHTSWPAHIFASIGEAQYQTPRPSMALRWRSPGGGACARGDDDRTALHICSAGSCNANGLPWSSAAVEADDSAGSAGCAEFCACVLRASRQ